MECHLLSTLIVLWRKICFQKWSYPPQRNTPWYIFSRCEPPPLHAVLRNMWAVLSVFLSDPAELQCICFPSAWTIKNHLVCKLIRFLLLVFCECNKFKQFFFIFCCFFFHSSKKRKTRIQKLYVTAKTNALRFWLKKKKQLQFCFLKTCFQWCT